jgi:DNA adenine methylase
VPLLPERFKTYREPFLGSGALFFLLEPTAAVLTDTCGELIATYVAVRDDPRTILRHLRDWKRDRDFYNQVRYKRSSGRLKRAAEFLYLNKMCWNGLYRVNSDGVFNVPYGLPKTDKIVDSSNLIACSRSLAVPGVRLACADFAEALVDTQPGDLVFLDPPFVTGHNNNGFIDYNEVLFSWSDQERLANEAARLADVGAHVIVANADHADVLDLYPGFKKRRFDRSSTIAANRAKRGRVTEALIWQLAPTHPYRG